MDCGLLSMPLQNFKVVLKFFLKKIFVIVRLCEDGEHWTRFYQGIKVKMKVAHL
jgi:hypothetical protein